MILTTAELAQGFETRNVNCSEITCDDVMIMYIT